MDTREQDFLKKLLATFKVEAQEHIIALSKGLLALEKAADPDRRTELIETIFREAHSLKGAARSVNAADVERTSHSLESVFSAMKRKELIPSPSLFDVLHHSLRHMEKILVKPDASSVSVTGEVIRNLENILKDISLPAGTEPIIPGKSPEKKGRVESSEKEESPKTSGEKDAIPITGELHLKTETVRIAVTRLDAILLQAGELLSQKLAASQRSADVVQQLEKMKSWGREWAKIEPEVFKIRHLLKKGNGDHQQPIKWTADMTGIFEFLDWNRHHMQSLETAMTDLAQAGERDRLALGGMVDNLLNDVKDILMLPVSTLLEVFPQLIRDLSRDRGKEADLVVRGDEIRIDKRILEELKDPLTHLERNSVDHGIEKPDVRRQKNKPPRGIIGIAVSAQDVGKVEILVSDDGAGINPGQVKSAAVKLGFLSPKDAERIKDEEILPLIFQSGLSTSTLITSISGRGLGLAIVREKVERLGGSISLHLLPDQPGTLFRIILPITLATFRGVFIRIEDRLFVLPTDSVERVLRVKREDIRSVEGRATMQIAGLTIPLVHLANILEMPQRPDTVSGRDIAQVVVVTTAEKRMALVVDEILLEQEVLVKPLGPQLVRVRNIAGAAILGSGRVAIILNISDLFQSAMEGTTRTAEVTVSMASQNRSKKSILVAEDSITARTLLKNILESAGYNVMTAVDGIDAWTTLKTNTFDLVVSDVDMPRMNGLGLTAKIRGEKRFAEMPVILVTALESREDRERGIDTGANAYIVKSGFDQTNLLDVIRRFI